MQITIVCGTNRIKSVSRKVSDIYASLLEEQGVEVDIIDLFELPAAFTRNALYENAGKDDEFNTFADKMWESERFIFVVPEYNGSFPGVLKAFIDGLRYPGTFKSKKCALVGLSAGNQGGGLAVSHLTDIFNYLGMHVLAEKPKLARIDSKLKEGTIDDKLYVELIEQQIESFLRF